MNEFKTPPDFSTTALGNPRDSNSVTFSPWSSQGIVVVVIVIIFCFPWHVFFRWSCWFLFGDSTIMAVRGKSIPFHFFSPKIISLFIFVRCKDTIGNDNNIWQAPYLFYATKNE